MENGIRKPIVFAFLIMGLLSMGLAVVVPSPVIRFVLWIAAVVILVTFVYLTYLYYQFSDQGGGVQRKLWTLVINHLHCDYSGQVLDIGTGNGPSAILLATKNPEIQVTGIDYLGTAWEYSQQVCVQNAVAVGVAPHTHFQKANASDLPFADGTFDAAVSHFVFHEVADAPDKRGVIRACWVKRHSSLDESKFIFAGFGIGTDRTYIRDGLKSQSFELLYSNMNLYSRRGVISDTPHVE